MNFEIKQIGGTIEITNAKPAENDRGIVIPASIDGVPVTSIGDSAFYGCDGLESVTIPESVTIIGMAAFADCYDLRSVTIPSSVTRIGEYAFNGCSNLTSVTISNDLTIIEKCAFGDCENLTIHGAEYSTAEEYAADHNIPFKPL